MTMTQTPEKYALLTVEGKEIKLPLVIGSEGEKGIDITGQKPLMKKVELMTNMLNS